MQEPGLGLDSGCTGMSILKHHLLKAARTTTLTLLAPCNSRHTARRTCLKQQPRTDTTIIVAQTSDTLHPLMRPLVNACSGGDFALSTRRPAGNKRLATPQTQLIKQAPLRLLLNRSPILIVPIAIIVVIICNTVIALSFMTVRPPLFCVPPQPRAKYPPE